MVIRCGIYGYRGARNFPPPPTKGKKWRKIENEEAKRMKLERKMIPSSHCKKGHYRHVLSLIVRSFQQWCNDMTPPTPFLHSIAMFFLIRFTQYFRCDHRHDAWTVSMAGLLDYCLSPWIFLTLYASFDFLFNLFILERKWIQWINIMCIPRAPRMNYRILSRLLLDWWIKSEKSHTQKIWTWQT